MTESDVVDILRAARVGRTLSDLARELKITPQYLFDILNGRRNPGPAVLRALKLEKQERYVRTA